MLVAIALAVLFSLGCALIRAYLGPTLFDRLLAVNVVGSLTVLLIALLGFIVGRPEFIDIAIVYALLNYIGVVAVLRFFESGRFGASRRRGEEEPP
ncbi:monovalent cation/H+ antiporter complex subunit F [Halomonas sp. BC04]|uniref:monovalent cation/H+ antiporter complex subunit F n=1 Tax=Halomonas sp. BC04 TaxID=1403540 RepID=UPI0003ED6BB9|nr:monovalent cation/H+ antiporter complex subunit F [Halomonas sp. BC04]EWH03437.1 pH regulation protein F [Halomonas sp. BC04]EWH03680.1 pH regulation protein F [Halomonas sp. BC04]